MPNCFTLTPKADPAQGPKALAKIDEEICALVNIPVHPVRYCMYWFDHIGFALACGKSFAEIREAQAAIKDEFTEKMLKIVDYLDEHYISDCFVQIGK